MYKIFVYDNLDDFSQSDLADALKVVSAGRRLKSLSYINDIDRKQSVIAELLLRYALQVACGISGFPDLCYGYHGKPMLKGLDCPRFNLSHCPEAVVCAVADSDIGIDVEPYSSYSEEVARTVFNDDELLKTLGSPSSFAELWTVKESFLKFTGEGLIDNLRSLLADVADLEFYSFHGAGKYACSVCSPVVYAEFPVFVDKNLLFYG